MDIKCYGSGSSGNCYHISDGDTQLLLECGLSFKKIQTSVKYKLSEISGCLITHRHGDHIKGLIGMLGHGVSCYISNAERDVLVSIDKKYDNHKLNGIEPLSVFKIGTLTILPFDVRHDTECPLGYLIQSDNGDKLLFATDTYYIPYTFQGITHLMIECNNSLEIMERNVKEGRLHPARKKRTESSHFSLENVVRFLSDCDLSRLKETYLIHLSDTNSDEEQFKRRIQIATGRPVYVF